MIVLVETYDIKKSNKLLPRTTVLDKIRNDFGSKHGDRYVYFLLFFFLVIVSVLAVMILKSKIQF